MKKVTLLNFALSALLFLGLMPTTTAQLQNTNWYFGNQAALNFNDGTQPPTTLTDNVMNTNGGSASISDSAGNLLFYTNGVSVWNNTHQIMPNGTGLLGSTTVSQAVVIVPKPNDADKYYIFSNGGNVMGFSGLSYSVVDMSLDGALGDVDINEKNILLLENVSQKMTSSLNPNDNSYWFVAFGSSDNPNSSDTFFTYKIDATGVNLTSQTTFAFSLIESEVSPGGQIKISPDVISLAMIHNTVFEGRGGEFEEAQGLFTFNFDNITGAVTLLNDSISLNDSLYSYGLEFSPDSNILYVTTTNSLLDASPIGRIHQIEYRDTGMGITPFLLYEGPDPVYGLQLGIDGKIYAVNSSGLLSSISTPNIPGFGANYAHENIDLSPNNAVRELPQLVPEVFLSIVEKNKPSKPVIQGNPFKDELKFKFKFIQTYTIEFFNSAGVLSKTFIYDDMTNRKILKVATSDLAEDTYYLIIRDSQSQIWFETVIKIE